MKKVVILFIIMALLLPLVGCTSAKPISENTMHYFQSLQHQTFWPLQNPVFKLQQQNGRSIALLNGDTHSQNWHITFYDVQVLKKDENNKPLVSVIKAEVFSKNNSSPQEYEFLVNENNEQSLKSFISAAQTSKQKYAQAVAEAKQYISKGKWDDAVSAALSALSYETTDEAKSLLDSAYYYKGRSFYKIGNYGEALLSLQRVQYSQSWIKVAKKIISAINAEKEAKLNRIRKEMNASTDEFKDVTFYEYYGSTPKYLQKGKIYLYPYIGVDETHKWYFLHLEMYLDNWLFAKQVYAIVGKQHFQTPAYDMFNKNVVEKVVEGGVYEQIDFPSSNDSTGLLVRSIVNAPLGTIIKFRVEGKDSYMEFTMTKSEQQLWKDVMYFYDYGIKKPSSP